jgi:hypothetical protein
LAQLVTQAGFEVEAQQLNEGSIYLWAKSPLKVSNVPKFDITETSDNFRIALSK